MSAHLRSLKTTCDESGCHATATEELHNTYNAPLGKYCRWHGRERLKALLAGEIVWSVVGASGKSQK